MKKRFTLFFLTAILFLAGCTADKPGKSELTVSAAASMKDSLEEVGQKYMDAHPNVKIIFNFGGSGSLQHQISQGAPVDLFISAAEDKFNTLQSENRIDVKHNTKLLGNELVLITPKGKDIIQSPLDLTDPNVRRLAIGIPESVPAGKYAKQTLSNLGLWDRLQGKLVTTKDVRQVLTYVETGNVDAGLVYKTDAMTSEKVQMSAIENQDLHEPIVYPAGVIASSKNHDEATRFYDFLKSEKAMTIFKKYGFNAAMD